MGMSHDLETAIEEGSTCVRVGTALFGKRKKPRDASDSFRRCRPRARGGRLLGGAARRTAAPRARRSRARATAMSRSTTWATTRCTREIYRAGHRAPRRGGAARCGTAPFFPRPTRPRPPTSTSSSTTTASGTAGWRGNCGAARAASGADSRYFRLPDAEARSRNARAPWWSTIRRRRATVRDTRPAARVVEIPHLFAPPAVARRGRGAALPRSSSGIAGAPSFSASSGICANPSG